MQGAVFWYHNRRMMTAYEDQVSISIQKDRDVTTSQLVIKDATTYHSGNYSCLPTWADPASVLVNVVVDGEQPAAMQTGSASHSTSELLTLLLLLLLLQSLFSVVLVSQR
ncbi:uncharacterized protein LOC143025251 [Oratosquilla oratoria]|uniref:uncharacterized protein LOC143025251 n=1 Tax=Oratosquilla oratoria TaxID=337810 RepID=UPI003F7756D8